MPQAPFISIEGLDGAGKSTQSQMLLEWLHRCGINAVRCREPGGTELGDKLRALLLDHRAQIRLRAEAMLFMASRAELIEKKVRPSLENGIVVICDRFLLSNVVYQGHAGGLDAEELWRIGHFVTCGVEPDLTFVLDMPLELAASRRGPTADRVEARSRAYHEKVRQGFLDEARRRPETISVIDASGTIDALQACLRERILGVLRQRGFSVPGGVS